MGRPRIGYVVGGIDDGRLLVKPVDAPRKSARNQNADHRNQCPRIKKGLSSSPFLRFFAAPQLSHPAGTRRGGLLRIGADLGPAGFHQIGQHREKLLLFAAGHLSQGPRHSPHRREFVGPQRLHRVAAATQHGVFRSNFTIKNRKIR